MSGQESVTPTAVIPFAPNNRDPDSTVVDDSGRSIVALLETAADMANKDCVRALELAHKLAFQLRAAEERARDAEERVRQLEADAALFLDRAVRAEDWLQHIHREVEQTFFQKRNAAPVVLK
jgi:hypothetical protein